ncbi:unnamed protein product [Protopolystoma xenopodis]|uniref:Uncharacterized protein n=1 Tax=Protopolystoma xenopodis TaxID=117903 RepID=A0A448X2C2_9PLAT|nr:unnamed protein product [Protopolystoma xenopodis]
MGQGRHNIIYNHSSTFCIFLSFSRSLTLEFPIVLSFPVSSPCFRVIVAQIFTVYLCPIFSDAIASTTRPFVSGPSPQPSLSFCPSLLYPALFLSLFHCLLPVGNRLGNPAMRERRTSIQAVGQSGSASPRQVALSTHNIFCPG